jgi:SHS2 domain-containing protein
MGVDVYGATRKALFCNAALALSAIMTAASSIMVKEERSLTIRGASLDDLWINYLRELLYLMNGECFLVRTLDIPKLDRKTLHFIAKGEPLDRNRHEIFTEIKAVTYHQAEVKKTAHGWAGRFIVDV